MENKELRAMISLLDDTDIEIIDAVSSNLMKQGTSVIPELERAWESTLNEMVQERLEVVIQNIQFNSSKENIRRWLNEGADYVLEGAVYLAQFQFPDLKLHIVDKEIEKIRKDVWLEINNNLTALEKVKILNYIIFEIYKF
ncbi:MAG: hypothetical protein HC906_19950 [Bacteroidales bacterium]|nr:hypothetical protein [Bacteroidales bacterium]